MPNRYPLRARAISIVDQPASPGERAFIFLVVSAMTLTTAVLILL